MWWPGNESRVKVGGGPTSLVAVEGYRGLSLSWQRTSPPLAPPGRAPRRARAPGVLPGLPKEVLCLLPLTLGTKTDKKVIDDRMSSMGCARGRGLLAALAALLAPAAGARAADGGLEALLHVLQEQPDLARSCTGY